MLNWGVCVLLDLFESAACAMVITLDLLLFTLAFGAPAWALGPFYIAFRHRVCLWVR